MAQTTLKADLEVAELIAECHDDPLAYVMAAFPWDTEKSIQVVHLPEAYRKRFPGVKWGPDVWACEFLDQLGEEIRKRGFVPGGPPAEPIRFSTASGHGIGKSTLVAWLIKFILDTRPYSKGIVTAGTQDQLKTKTWAELGKWHHMSLTSHLYDYSASRGNMSLRRHVYPGMLDIPWRCDAQTCREENSESFAGQHAAVSTSFYIFDEASQIPGKIFEVRKGGLATGEPMVFDFGNPTRNSGDFFENTVGKQKHRYITRSIDSRTVAITNKPYFEEMRKDYGEESDLFKVRCRGEFPSAGSAQFIPSDLVDAAGNRDLPPNYHSDKSLPLIIGVDVARFGDDESVIWARLGYDARSFPPVRFSGLDTVQLVGQVISVVRSFTKVGLGVDAVFVDGGGIGGGVVDQLRHLGYKVTEVQFGGSPTDKNTYRFKSDELWGTLRDNLSKLVLPVRAGAGSIGQDIFDQLTQREFGHTLLGNKIHLETKKDMKARLGFKGSPDLADALALTFASPVQKSNILALGQIRMALSEYDPLNPSF